MIAQGSTMCVERLNCDNGSFPLGLLGQGDLTVGPLEQKTSVCDMCYLFEACG